MSLFAWDSGDDSAFERFGAQETAEREAYIAQEAEELKGRRAPVGPELQVVSSRPGITFGSRGHGTLLPRRRFLEAPAGLSEILEVVVNELNSQVGGEFLQGLSPVEVRCYPIPDRPDLCRLGSHGRLCEFLKLFDARLSGPTGKVLEQATRLLVSSSVACGQHKHR